MPDTEDLSLEDELEAEAWLDECPIQAPRILTPEVLAELAALGYAIDFDQVPF